WYDGIFYHSKFKKVALEGERPAALCNPSRISNGHGGVIYTHQSSLTSNGIPIILEISPEVKKLAPYALTEIDLSATNLTNMLKNVEEIGSSAFQGCHLEGQLTIPLSVKKMGSSVFENNNISSVKIESTQFTEIPQGFLQWNSQLNQITWPDNITVIGEYAFAKFGIVIT
ncbi:MAG: leucine-rich repeat domain-containing protein, partial [Bacteroides sp.]